MVYRFSETGKEPDYKIAVKLLGREMVSLNVDTETELNGSKPLLFFSFMLATALIAGLMFLSVVAVAVALNPQQIAAFFAGLSQ